MKNIFIISLLILIAATSCTTSKRCAKKFPPQVKVYEKDSVVVRYEAEMVPIYYTVYDTITREVVTETTPVEVRDDGFAYSETSILENEFCTSVAIVNQKLRHELELKDQVRVITGTQLAEIINSYYEYYKTNKETITVEVNVLTWWQRTQMILFRIMAVLLLIRLLYAKFKHKLF